jgi:DNA-binding response OmpR family regulator
MRENDIPLDLIEAADRRKVLIVDDDPEIVELMVDVLERDGRFEVRTASSGYDAGVVTQEWRPDLMVLDYMLPDVNGNVVCKTIRQNRTFSHMRIIIVSGVINQDEIDELLQLGADAFMKKPFSIDELVTRLVELAEA